MEFPDIILPIGHFNSPERNKEVTVKFSKKPESEVAPGYTSYQIWFDYEITDEEKLWLNKHMPNNKNFQTIMRNGYPWTPHYFYLQADRPNEYYFRYWISGGYRTFKAYNHKQICKQLYSLIFKNKKLYFKEPKNLLTSNEVVVQ